MPTAIGAWRGRVVFELPDYVNMPEKRNKEDFNKVRYTDYQIKKSTLVNIDIDCIKSFPLDYMHLLYVFSVSWCDEKDFNVFKIGSQSVQIITSAN